jgi:hypothetical protein
MTAPQTPKTEILHELSRELSMRRTVFPRWVASKRLTADQAAHRIAQLQRAYDYIIVSMPDDYRPKAY